MFNVFVKLLASNFIQEEFVLWLFEQLFLSLLWEANICLAKDLWLKALVGYLSDLLYIAHSIEL